MYIPSNAIGNMFFLTPFIFQRSIAFVQHFEQLDLETAYLERHSL